MQKSKDVFLGTLESSSRIVGFTGAGISTESGISDYRSKGGIWDRYQPVYYDEFLRDEKKRMLYWERKAEMWPQVSNAKPNKGHAFFKTLYDRNKLLGIITQNIDGLHEKSGIPAEYIVNLHGNTLKTRCLSCGFSAPTAEVFTSFNSTKTVPVCPDCGGLLKPATISFGQQLDPREIQKAEELSRNCDFMITMGSTLIVMPASGFPSIAKKSGAKLAIINLSETPLDAEADFVFNEPIGDFVESLAY